MTVILPHTKAACSWAIWLLGPATLLDVTTIAPESFAEELVRAIIDRY